MSIESLVRYFGAIEDPRCSGKVEHRLLDILIIAVAAVLRHSHLTHAWPGIAAALLVSSFLTLVTAGHTAQTLLAWQARRIRRGTPDLNPTEVQAP